MKKLLIVGGSHRDIPLIQKAKELGFYTITVGKLDYYIGYKYSHKNYKIDFRDMDALKKLIEDENIEYIIPGSGELPMLIAAKLSKDGNYDKITTLEILHNKFLFKNLCLSLDINVPNGKVVNCIDEVKDLKFPLIVKPLNLSGGKGINKVENVFELENSISLAKNLSSSDKVIVEEFVKGPLIAYSVIFKKQKVLYSFCAREYEENYYVTTTVKTTLGIEFQETLNRDLEKIAKELSLKDGLLHVQFLLSKNKAKFLEVTRRIPGDLFPILIDLSDGVEYSKSVLKSYLGEVNDLDKLLIKNKDEYNIRYCILAKSDYKLDYIYIDKNIEVLHRVDIYTHGQELKTNNLVSIVIIKYEKEILDNINKLIYVKGII